MGLRDHIPKSSRKRIGDAGRASEKAVAKSIGARLRPASGAMEGAKGDMTVADFLIEAKSTTANSISIQYADLGKISNEALSLTKRPALTVTFTDHRGRSVNYGEWVLVPLRVWTELVDGL